MNPEELQRQFEEARNLANSLKSSYSQCAQDLGKVEAVLESTKPYWVNLASQTGESKVSALISGQAVLTELSHSLKKIEIDHKLPTVDLRTISLSASSFASNTVATSYFINVSNSPLEYKANVIPLVDHRSDNSLADRLSRIDPDLGRVCREIWECLYGTTSDPERGALFMMRQTWDHLFGRLSPDDDVRGSAHFSTKEGEKPDQVTRDERIAYAIDTHIKHETHKENLKAASRQALDLYQELNRAHKRGSIDKTKATASLHSLYDWLEQWATALEASA